ncbi:hypothetical protein EJ110_NYTH20684 [Nymphaea thermarum]|nr:hypothetical protein EJ110_NYTH20684 [Nymphaea thermarum]
MPATDYQGTSVPFGSLGRTILSLRRDQVHSMEGSSESGSAQEQRLEAFQRMVTENFHQLASCNPDELLSLSWIRRLLDAFLACQEEFRLILMNHRFQFAKPPLDRQTAEFFERSVKVLDLCNAIRDGIEQVRQWRKQLEIVLSALDARHRTLGEGQFRRARKALSDLAVGMLEEKESGSFLAQRNRSFGRNSTKERTVGHFRSLSWSVSRSWSAARQLQAIGNNLNPPRSNDILATGGLSVLVYTMNTILLFVMWALVAAIPCQDRGIQIHFSVPRHFSWASSVLPLHEKIMEEAKKRDRKNSCGLLKEIHQIEKCARQITELADSVHFPLPEAKQKEVRQGVDELAHVCETLTDGLDPFERQIRDVFHRIVNSRTEGLDCLGRPHSSE